MPQVCTQIQDVSTKLRDIPAIPCLKQQKKSPCVKFLSGTFHGRGQGYPDVWVSDVPRVSCPKTLSLGCVSVLIPKGCNFTKTKHINV